jgi:hypothetical protein
METFYFIFGILSGAANFFINFRTKGFQSHHKEDCVFNAHVHVAVELSVLAISRFVTLLVTLFVLSGYYLCYECSISRFVTLLVTLFVLSGYYLCYECSISRFVMLLVTLFVLSGYYLCYVCNISKFARFSLTWSVMCGH